MFILSNSLKEKFKYIGLGLAIILGFVCCLFFVPIVRAFCEFVIYTAPYVQSVYNYLF